ncbi:hypothetical protein ACPESV_24645 [Streptomyces umbrinus]|uniref:hypothetical protein n=1 Tax=Streptomyces umbrinus TaxID=67370 RepID=UPI003C2FAC01
MSPAPPNATRTDIIAMLQEGHSNLRISRELRCDKTRVRRIRDELNLPAYVSAEQTRTLEEKWATHTRPVDGGHLEWTGERVNTAGTPVMRYKEESYSPAAVAFTIHHGREPKGYAIADCGLKHCVAPGHILDEAGRLQARRQLRASDQPSHCPYGHDQAEHGKFETDGRAYCGRCKTLDKQERRDPSLPRRERTRPRPASPEDVFRAHVEETSGGHVRWTGPIAHQTPAVRFEGRMQSAYRVAFRLHHGREPVGLATPGCDVPGCVAGAHVEDRPMREHTRQLYQAIFGEAS